MTYYTDANKSIMLLEAVIDHLTGYEEFDDIKEDCQVMIAKIEQLTLFNKNQ